MQIIDAHHHLWSPEKDTADIGYVWLKNMGAMKPFGDPTAIQRDYLPKEFAAESKNHELIASVHLQADGAIPDPVKESQWLEYLSTTKPKLPSAHIGFVDLSAEDAEATLERYHALPGFRGVRQILSRLDDRPDLSFATEHFLRNPRWRQQYRLLAAQNLSFDLQLYPEQMMEAAAFFSQHPDIPVIIDHAGSPYDQSLKGLVSLKYGLQALANLPHCHIKLCGFGMFDPDWSADSINPVFEIILKTFGPKRMLFGSNYPVDKLMKSYDYIVDQLISCCNRHGLKDKTQERIFFSNARDFYRLTL